MNGNQIYLIVLSFTMGIVLATAYKMSTEPLLPSLDDCAKSHNVYSCHLIAVPDLSPKEKHCVVCLPDVVTL